MWFYSVPERGFMAYVSHVNVCVNDVEPAVFKVKHEDIDFNLRTLSSVYEVTIREQFASSLLLADNMKNLIEEYVDITDDLFVAVLDNITAPILIGNKSVIERLVSPSDEGSYVLHPLVYFLKDRS